MACPALPSRTGLSLWRRPAGPWPQLEVLEPRLLLSGDALMQPGLLAATGLPPGNQPPVAEDDAATTTEGRCVIVNVVANDSDPDGDRVWVAGYTPAGDGRATYIGFGRFSYLPDDGFAGEDSFDYTIRDSGQATDSATVTITVEPGQPNQPPDAVDDQATTPQGRWVTIHALDNDSDPDGDRLRVVGLTQPANGTVLHFGCGRFVYAPRRGFAGTDSFTYTIGDGQGAQDSATVTVLVEEAPPNQPPDAADDEAATTQGTPVVVDALANDSDPDGDRIRVVGLTQPTNGRVIWIGCGGFVYAPNPDFVGTDSFTYTIGDGYGGHDTATVTVTVAEAPPNEPPQAADDTAAATQGTWVTIDALANDSDPDGDRLWVVGLTQPANGTALPKVGGKFWYRSAPDFVGVDTFTYTIGDGHGARDTATVTVTVEPAPQNQPPVAADDQATTTQATPVTIDALANDSDPDGDRLWVVGLTQPGNGTVIPVGGGRFLYLPRLGFVGTDTFTYQIGDGHGLRDDALVTVVVEPRTPA